MTKWILAGMVLAAAALGQQAMTNGMSAQQAAAWTSASAAGASGVNLVQPMAITAPFSTSNGYTTALVSFSASGTITGGVVSFEVTTATDGNSGWQATSCYRIGATPSSDTTYTLTGANQIWQCPAAGVLFFRVRLSTAITSTGTANITVQATTAAAAASNAYIPIDQPQLTNPINVAPAVGASYSNLITRTYLGFASANTIKTVTGTFTTSVAGHNVLAIGCSGNYNSANWAGAVTDGGLNTYTQLTFGANSTTQFCGAYLATNVVATTSFTFTISGSNSATTTVAIAAYDIGNSIPLLYQSVDTFGFGSGSATTSLQLTTYGSINSASGNELAISAACASTGTLTANPAYVFDSGSTAIASGSGCVTFGSQSAWLPAPTNVTGIITDGSSAAYAMVLVILRAPSIDGLPRATQTFPTPLGGNNPGEGSSATSNGIVVTPNYQWVRQSAPGASATASVANSAVAGVVHVVQCIGWSMVSGTSAPTAADFTVTLVDSGAGTVMTWEVASTTATTVSFGNYSQCGLNIPSGAGKAWTFAFSGNQANLLEAVFMTGYDVASPLNSF